MDSKDWRLGASVETEIRAGDTMLPPYQRTNLSLQNIKAIKADFSWEKFGRPVVYLNETGLYEICDGQHRIRAVRELWGDATMIPVVITTRSEYRARASLFVESARYRKGLSPIDLFRAEVEAGHTEATEIKAICDDVGVKIGHRHSRRMAANLCGAVLQLRRAHRLGDGVLERTLRLLAAVWPNDSDRHAVPNLQGLSHFLAVYPHARDERLIKRLTAFSDSNAGGISLSRAVIVLQGYYSGGGTSTGKFSAMVILKEYNKGLRASSRLDADALTSDV